MQRHFCFAAELNNRKLYSRKHFSVLKGYNEIAKLSSAVICKRIQEYHLILKILDLALKMQPRSASSAEDRNGTNLSFLSRRLATREEIQALLDKPLDIDVAYHMKLARDAANVLEGVITTEDIERDRQEELAVMERMRTALTAEELLEQIKSIKNDGSSSETDDIAYNLQKREVSLSNNMDSKRLPRGIQEDSASSREDEEKIIERFCEVRKDTEIFLQVPLHGSLEGFGEIPQSPGRTTLDLDGIWAMDGELNNSFAEQIM